VEVVKWRAGEKNWSSHVVRKGESIGWRRINRVGGIRMRWVGLKQQPISTEYKNIEDETSHP
jgi:hypothetical protein